MNKSEIELVNKLFKLWENLAEAGQITIGEGFGDNFKELGSKVVEYNKEKATALEKLQWENKALKDALQYLVDTKNRKDTIGKDSIYFQRKNLGWMKAKQLLNK